MISISFIPCNDQHDSHQDEEIVVNSNDHDHAEDSENCSPLCVCNCCHTNLVFNGFNFIAEATAYNSSGNSIYVTSIIEGYKGLPLQPPRS
ncbi:hypothetical protein OO013_09895 [Mangrovivirga sp. M17]|uniref:Uncharacterized protein n=2 Tax=Mangrovivirga halotolerans TaxID=2993936 RepID=A0ABT3RS55_9BACT|nr:DUF6660 family protein [Mangrovivirga halotolerans]MCX2744178.1 hypothetical protein [Mangrovivirga halotolerans]